MVLKWENGSKFPEMDPRVQKMIGKSLHGSGKGSLATDLEKVVVDSEKVVIDLGRVAVDQRQVNRKMSLWTWEKSS